MHGTAVLIGAAGVLIRGPSGSGKSLLALELLRLLPEARLIADDRVDLVREGESIWMVPPPVLAGQIELRGRGIVRRPWAERGRLALVADLEDTLVRMPEPPAFETDVLGLSFPRCPLPRRGLADPGHQHLLLAEALALLPGNPVQNIT